MALTAQQRQQLRDWLQANVHKAATTCWYAEGVKDENGKPVMGVRPDFDPLTGEDIPGTERYDRTFIKRSHVQLDLDEVARRVWRKAQKHGIDLSKVQALELAQEHADKLMEWAGATVWGSTFLTTQQIDEIDPDG